MNVIEIENLWKEYRLGVIGHGTLAQDLQSWWARLRGKEDPNAKIASILSGQEKQVDGDHFWALRDLNLEVKQGEVLGIIGKNGAGKSTFLKVLSRVTAPTRGNIRVRGRIASLLEVGTGFHPELTGRQNVFMNGTILGMSRQEISNKFDEIVDFSGVETFIDTPVKRYSSGMYVRLAFAVAAHLEPEILIVDEVLAVGDTEFQKKCIGKMKEVSGQGRTVLFVSHNLATIEKLCSKVTVLSDGKVWFSSENIEEAITEYEKISVPSAGSTLAERTDRTGEGRVRLVDFTVTGRDGHSLERVRTGQAINFNFEYKVIDRSIEYKDAVFALSLYSRNGNALSMLGNHLSGQEIEICRESGVVTCCIDKLPLTSGYYDINLIVRNNDIIEDYVLSAYKLDVAEGDYYNSGGSLKYSPGSVMIDCSWNEQCVLP